MIRIIKKQLEKFNELKDALDDLPPYVHVANSAASMWHDDCGGNAVRYGITMYGLNPSGRELELPCEIKPAFTLESELVSVRLLESGTGIGYGKHTLLTSRNGSGPFRSGMPMAG